MKPLRVCVMCVSTCFQTRICVVVKCTDFRIRLQICAVCGYKHRNSAVEVTAACRKRKTPQSALGNRGGGGSWLCCRPGYFIWRSGQAYYFCGESFIRLKYSHVFTFIRTFFPRLTRARTLPRNAHIHKTQTNGSGRTLWLPSINSFARRLVVMGIYVYNVCFALPTDKQPADPKKGKLLLFSSSVFSRRKETTDVTSLSGIADASLLN